MMTDRRLLRDALGRFATGVCVITARLPDQTPFGMTINSFSSVSLDPPLVLWSLAKKSTYFDHVMAVDRYSINVLGSDQAVLSTKFSGKERILGEDHTDISNPDFPVIKDAISQFNCEVNHRYEGGDHIIIVGRVLDFKTATGADPLIFFGGDYRSLSR